MINSNIMGIEKFYKNKLWFFNKFIEFWGLIK